MYSGNFIIFVITLIFAGNESNIGKNERIEITNKITEDKEIQVEAKLSLYSPRKRNLRSKIAILRQKNKNVERRIEVKKTNNKSLNTFEEWLSLCDKYLPPQTATFTKTQAKLYQQARKGIYCG
ncbi:uncharacterized protein LOC116848396 isoform X2 [Odontomachus brunneus]|uniref:uncharacterized protein LOC116848396 isoform X2 n=1 Tax=Odontomachus brunneus TaxID=486640 RepID=UPI0013F26948|nr:uncharacterized protein LOC116848396 isoform X2 [Odontomachus brunneus]